MPANDKTKYNRGDAGEGGSIINQILGASPRFIVFFTDNDVLRWEIDDENIPDYFPECLTRFDDLQSRISSSILLRRVRRGLRQSLGRALYSAVGSNDSKAAKRCFDDVSMRINTDVDMHARLCYVASAIFATVSLGVICVVAHLLNAKPPILTLLVGASSGAVGATVSILFRSGQLSIPRYATPIGQFFLGTSRIFLGSLCGLVLVVLILADLVLGVVKDNAAGIAAFSVVSGFSERYLPEILKGFENRVPSPEGANSPVEQRERLAFGNER